MTDRYNFQHGPLEVKAEHLGYDSFDVKVPLNSKEIYAAIAVQTAEDEAAELFKAFKAVYEAGEAGDETV